MRTVRPLTLFASFSSLLALALICSLSLAQSTPKLVYTYTGKAISGPATVSENGFQNILFVNDSGEELDSSFYRLHDGVTLDQVAATDKALNASFAAADIRKFFSLLDAVGGVHPKAHARASAHIRLEPGNYVVSASTGGGPDPYKAVYMNVKVTAGQSAAAPRADFALHMSDFHFDFPKTMKAGEHLWQVSNIGAQPHFALVFKLSKGKAAKDVISWMDHNNAGPPPFVDSLFIQGATSGQTFYTPISYTPGTYVAVCPMPNLKTGKPQYADGMVSTFTVR